MDAAESLGDPTDPDTGWDIVFKKVKTGPLPFNVEYTLQVLQCKVRALTEEERALIEAEKSIDEKYPRPTQKNIIDLLDKLKAGTEDEEGADDTAVPESAKDL